MSLRSRTFVRSSFLLFLIFTSCLSAVEPENASDLGRVVAVADIHGNYDGLVDILQETALIDKENQWIGGDAILVQTGDILDRGKDVKLVMDLLMDLQEQAPKTGGKVIVLVGNHEMMNISRHFRDASKDAIATFQKGETDTDGGLAAYKRALGPEGVYGKWLRTLPVAVVVGDTLFLHGGISPQMARESVSDINAQASKEIAAYDEQWLFLVQEGFITEQTTMKNLDSDFKQTVKNSNLSSDKKSDGEQAIARLAKAMDKGLLFRENGPLWFRGFASWKENKLSNYLPKYLKNQKAKRVVSGHSVQDDGQITVRLNDSVFLIDTGMLSDVYEGGRPSALEIDQGQVTAFYPTHKSILVMSVAHMANRKAPAHGWSERLWLGPDGTPLPFTNNHEAVEFLKTAEIVSVNDIPFGVTNPKKILLQKGDVKAHAVFRHYHQAKGKQYSSDKLTKPRNFRDSYKNEVAAYELNILLGMGTLPPTVIRMVDGVPGSLQLWVEETMTDGDRITKKLTPPNIPHWDRQFWDLRVFDNLVNNTDRNQGNILIDEQWRIWLIDHSRAFAKDPTLPNPIEVERVSRQLWKALQQLDIEVARTRLEPHLESDEIGAFFVRHRKLMIHIRRRMEKQGTDEVLFDHKLCCGM